jgi:hypothetical protein
VWLPHNPSPINPAMEIAIRQARESLAGAEQQPRMLFSFSCSADERHA